MKTLHYRLRNISHLSFKDWKYDLRHRDITNKVINLLDGIPQSTYYHPEFDALLHTYYVCRAVVLLKRYDLLEAAFLHDVGKATKTNIGEKRIYHFGHPKKSLEFVQEHKNYIKHYDLTVRMTEKHMDLPFGHKKLKTDKDLSDFIYADKYLSKKLYLNESNFLNHFANKIKEWNVHRKQKNQKKVVTILVGIAGSGKTRYTKMLDSKYIVSQDQIRKELTGDVSDQSMNKKVREEAKIRMRINLELYGNVILDATNVNKWLRVEFMSSFNDTYKKAIVFNTDPDVAINRVKNDIEDNIDRSNVPEDVVRKQYKLFRKGFKSLYNEFNRVVLKK